jgi:hypothetical protein
MKSEYGYQSYNFEEELKKRGFIIPTCAFSNYYGTSRSLSSILNMNYLDALGIKDQEVNNIQDDDPSVLYSLLHHNKVLEFLRDQGYKFVAFRGFFPLNDFKEADYYYNYFEDMAGYDELEERNFRSLFLQSTILKVTKAILENRPDDFRFLPQSIFNLFAPDSSAFYSRSYQWYQQHMYQFEQLEKIPEILGKKFIYSHFYTTHQPYVLSSDGKLIWPINENNAGYISAAKYTTTRLLTIIDHIIQTSKTPPIIIIQADHGQPGSDEFDRYKILNAYYLPNVDPNQIDPMITPVNTFRLVFNKYFGKNIPYLPNIIYEFMEGSNTFQQVLATCNLY